MLSDRQRKTTNVQKQKYRGEYMCVRDGKSVKEVFRKRGKGKRRNRSRIKKMTCTEREIESKRQKSKGD